MLSLGHRASFYPERESRAESLADRAWSQGLSWFQRRFRRRIADPAAFARAVAACASEVPDVPLSELVPDLRYRLRRAPLSDDLLAECFALYSIAEGDAKPSAGVLGAARALALGGIVELAEAADRRAALAFAAAAMTLHGTQVHLLAASPARARALAQALEAPFAALGFRLALVTQDGTAPERQDACSRLVLCGTLRDIGMDYLRDRIALGGRARAILGTLDRLAGDAPAARKLLLLGMQCALVEDADEVMLDDSRAPLTVATQLEQPGERLACEQALELAKTLREPEDFRFGPDGVQVTPPAAERIDRLTQALGGAWALREQRDELVAGALEALHVLQRDRDYRVNRGRVIFPPRAAADEPDDADELLQKLVEVKEGCRLSGRRVVLAQMAAPRVLGRYLHLAGTCADARRLESEFWRLYRLTTVRAGAYPSGTSWDARLVATRARKREVLLEEVRARAARGSVVVALRSPLEAQSLLEGCAGSGIAASLVRGEGTAEEQQAIARLDAQGTVLVTAYPAERNVARAQARGVPLHLIVVELHDAERQIVRIARAYAADSCEILLSLEDDAIKARLGARALAAAARSPHGAKRFVLRALRSAEQATAQARRDAASMDSNLDDLLAFSGQRE